MKKVFLLIPLIIGCSSQDEKSEYQKLTEYEGHYEYVGETTLFIAASGLDTSLYAILDNAKYPLTHIKQDSFVNIRNQPVVFDRDEKGHVVSYTSGGQNFKLLNKTFQKAEMFPRKELFHTPEDYAYASPIPKNDGLKTGLLSEAFSKPEPILEMVKETIKGRFPEVHSILIYKNDQLVLEEYFYGYDENTQHQTRSANKPFIGALLGIAIEKGFIKSEKEKLLPFFVTRYPDIENMDDRKRAVTIEDFLTYRHGMDCENNNPESQGNELLMMESKDWVKHTLDLPMVAKAGTYSSYCTGCSLTLGSLIEIVTTKKIEAFAQKHLFEPLGITNYRWTFEPNPASTTTFNQMYLTPRDLIKLAKMYKDGGQWNGQQIIPQAWVTKTFDMEEGDYGYLWEHKYFVVDGKQYNSYLASGNGGQKINIWPELDMITVFTGGNYNSYEIYKKSTPPNEMIPEYILKALN